MYVCLERHKISLGADLDDTTLSRATSVARAARVMQKSYTTPII